MSFTTVIALLFNYGFGIALLIYYFSNFKSANSYMKYGAVTSAFYLIFTLPTYFSAVIISFFPLLLVFISALKIAVYTCTGFYVCSEAGLSDMPLIRRLFKENSFKEINYRKYTIYTLLVILCSVLLTIVLFRLTSPEASDFVKKFIENNGISSKSVNILSINTFLVALSPVISEEIIFRLLFPNLLFKLFHLEENRYWIVIIISAAFWAVCHSNMLNPEWVKLVQIFPMGLALGGLYKKYGLESSIIAHAAFNVIMVFISGSLIG